MAVAIQAMGGSVAVGSRSAAPRRAASRPAHMPQGVASAPGAFSGRAHNPLLHPRHQQQRLHQQQQPQQQQQQQQQQRQHRGGALVCQGLFGLGLPEIAVIAGVAALVFGPSKLPELGKGLGKTVKSFQVAANEFKSELEAATKDGEGGDAAAAAAGKEAGAGDKAAPPSKGE